MTPSRAETWKWGFAWGYVAAAAGLILLTGFLWLLQGSVCPIGSGLTAQEYPKG
jgi:hypothetical protein